MHSTISYKGLDRHTADAEAVRDILEYLSPEGWTALLDYSMAAQTTGDIQGINHAIGFAGISGYPFHAFCRTFCLAAYRGWMHGGDDPVLTDEQGFTLEHADA